MKIAIIAPPWLDIPPKGYGGIEVMLDGLLTGLSKQNVDVELFGTSGTVAPKGIKVHSLYKTEQYKNVHRPMYESLPILGAHMQFSLNIIRQEGNFDIIHDHNGYYGLQLISWASFGGQIPPILHTLHGPPFSSKDTLKQGQPDNRLFWQQLDSLGRAFIVGISDALMSPAPKSLLPSILPTVYNSIDVPKFNFSDNKKDYFITLARFSREKGQHIAAKLCAKLNYKLCMAGPVAGIKSNRKLLLELANPLSPYRQTDDFKYYSDFVLPFTVHHPNITSIGNVGGSRKQSFISKAKALLFPITWDEPFGMAVIEAMACGTPVVAMNRGAMPEIIQHGYNGFLANSESEFAEYMQRVDEIDPYNCRKSVEQKFSADIMAKAYIERYREVIRRTKK